MPWGDGDMSGRCRLDDLSIGVFPLIGRSPLNRARTGGSGGRRGPPDEGGRDERGGRD